MSVATPTSLLAALKAFWTTGGYNASIAPMYLSQADPKATYPLIILDSVDEILPGESPDDIPVEMFLRVEATDSDQARQIGRSLEAVIGPNAGRNPLVWTIGGETFNEPYENVPDKQPRRGKGGDPVWTYRMHRRWYISGKA